MFTFKLEIHHPTRKQKNKYLKCLPQKAIQYVFFPSQNGRIKTLFQTIKEIVHQLMIHNS
jgi:hypothetical protein